MPRKRIDLSDDPNALDVNQVVSYNFKRLRAEREITQDEAAERIEPFIGQRLTKATISSIEKSFEDRRRAFTVHEIVAFALGFDVPAHWFLLPPPHPGLTLAGADGLPLANLWRLLLGTPQNSQSIESRMKELQEVNPRAVSALSAQLGGAAGLPYKHYREEQMRQLLEMVDDEYSHLVDLFEDMAQLAARFKSVTTTQALAADAPRKAYRYATDVFLGRNLYRTLSEGRDREERTEVVGAISRTKDLPWDEIIDTDDEQIAEAVRQLANAIEPKLRKYLHENRSSAGSQNDVH